MLALAFSHGGEVLASGSSDRTVRIWNEESHQPLHTLASHTGAVRAVAFSPSDDTVAGAGEDSVIRIWRVADAKLLQTLAGQTNDVSALAFTPDGLTLASGGADGSVFLWDTRTWTVKARLPGHQSRVHALRFSSNNEFLASGSDEFLRIWDLADPVHSFNTLQDRVRAISFYELKLNSPGDPKPKFESSDGRAVRLWQPSGAIAARRADGKTVTHIMGPWRPHIGGIFSKSQTAPTAVAVDLGLMASGGTNGTLEVCDLDSYSSARVAAHQGRVMAVAFSPGATKIASGGDDTVIKLWDVRVLMQAPALAKPGK